MNKNQKRVIIIGIILVVLSWLFPYYDGELRVEGRVYSRVGLGYYSIFVSPSIKDIRKTYPNTLIVHHFKAAFGYRINLAFLVGQMIVILLSCIGLILFFSTRRKPTKESLSGTERTSFYKK